MVKRRGAKTKKNKKSTDDIIETLTSLSDDILKSVKINKSKKKIKKKKRYSKKRTKKTKDKKKRTNSKKKRTNSKKKRTNSKKKKTKRLKRQRGGVVRPLEPMSDIPVDRLDRFQRAAAATAQEEEGTDPFHYRTRRPPALVDPPLDTDTDTHGRRGARDWRATPMWQRRLVGSRLGADRPNYFTPADDVPILHPAAQPFSPRYVD